MDGSGLGSGRRDGLAGGSVNLGEGGVFAVLAGELLPGETVGVEILLPLAAEPLRARALVRHHDRLQSGMEFFGLSVEQQAAIRDWAAEVGVEPERRVRPVAIESGAGSDIGGSGGV